MEKLDKTIPKILYKYRTLKDDNHKQILNSNRIFFSSGRHFNDPYEMGIPLCHDLGTEKQILQHASEQIKYYNPGISKKEYLAQLKEVKKKRYYKNPKRITEYHEYQKEFRFKNLGIFTVSERKDSLVMWAFYAQSHEGFCVGFDTKKMIEWRDTNNKNIKLRKVEYLDKFPQINPFTKKGYDKTAFMKPLITKSSHWCFEKEFRYLYHGGADKRERLSSVVIEEVILGVRMCSTYKKEIIQVLRKRKNKVKLFEAKLKKDEFGLIFDEIDLLK